jgi:hypothetical protein
MLVEKLALTYLRMQRCARAEAELHARTWEEFHKCLENESWERLQVRRETPVRAVAFRPKTFERMVKTIDLYDSRLTSQFLKLIKEIERQQRQRKDSDEPQSVPSEPATQPHKEQASDTPADAPQTPEVVCSTSPVTDDMRPEVPPHPVTDLSLPTAAPATEKAQSQVTVRESVGAQTAI